ncbi:ATP-binding cassette domain-containing protein [Ethanoligenens harbinense]|uniref:Daunorubicin resistance ABC transporter ATPase subunit n=1 Tax=Ethanoligenens harbinense (strain DSM 18485 / JCM 12961 / CGMCC 1.5033 / YUAN-3) TaxID=663278 RepID=E6U8B6_ETHHY|nr:ATP-binding cassette domain-containing protein [Ethanoligenens harbinense]ADU28235.1 daunorubicin resistance ABC transporter ATPase subunit [Ethanoligenens harbinense YUAN-3]
MDMIVTEDLCKTFPGRSGRGGPVEAVKHVNLRVKQGEIFGFLGPNGAGKTTTMRMLTTLLPPSGGKARVVGYDLAREAGKIRQKIGYVSQKGGCYDLATGYENLVLQGRLYGLSKAAAVKKADELVRVLHLEEYCHRKVKTYSGGQRRHIDLGMGVMHDPALLFLDEPTTGLDPTSRANFWDEIRRLCERGITVFLTTHYLDEADSLCDTICIMDHGTVAAQGTVLELKRQVAGDIITIGMAPDAFGRAEALLRPRADVKELRRADGLLKLYVEAGEKALPEILPLLVEENIAVTTVEMTRVSLDEVFLKMTGRSLLDEDRKEAAV